MSRAACAGLIFLTILLPAAPAAAQPQVEVFGSLITPISAPTGVFITHYVPKLVYGTVTGGAATHTLNLEGDRRVGFDFGVNWLPSGPVGVQFLVERTSHSFGGANPDYQLAIDYLARQPPDYVERPYSSRRAFSWPDTTGQMAVRRVGANGLARFGGRAVDLTVSGGFLWSRVSGVFEQAGYYEYRLGGHSTLFYNDVLLGMAFDEAWQLGYNVGAEVGFRAGRQLAFTAGARFFGPSLEPQVVVGDILNTVIFEVPRADIEAVLGGRRVEFDPWGSPALRFGVRVGF